MAVANGWLTVTVKADARTGLAAPDVFSFGNLIGDIGSGAAAPIVNSLDLLAVRRNLFSTSSVTGRFDFDRDGRVSAADFSTARSNYLRRLSLVVVQSPPLLSDRTLADSVASAVLQ
jgi:hypothetical protein